jgi:hypothetical protein
MLSFRSFDPRRTTVLLSLSGLLLASGCGTARAQGGPAEAVAAGAAVAGVVVEVIGGLSTWIAGQSDDCAAACLSAVWGKDCDLKQLECQDTGYFYAQCRKNAANGCGDVTSSALAQESPVGMWAGYDVITWVVGWTKPLHNRCDQHAYKGWAKASVDGTADVTTEGSPGSGGAPGGRLDPNATPTPWLPPTAPRWPDGTVLVVAKLDTLTLSVQTNALKPQVYRGRLLANGQPVWTVSARLTPSGQLTTTGPLSTGQFTKSFDAATNTWTAQVIGYRYEVPVDTLDMPAGAPGVASLADGGTSGQVTVSMESENEDAGDTSSADVCEVTTVTCASATEVNDAGEYVCEGLDLAIAGSVTILDVLSTSPYLDLVVADATGTLRVLDPFATAQGWRAGQKVSLRGVLALFDGEPVLTHVSMVSGGVIVDPVPVEPAPIEDGKDVGGRTPSLSLDQNEPNPFNPVTSIRFALAAPSDVTLRLFSITGQLVRTLVDRPLAAGTHEVLWDGRDGDGGALPSGVYFYALEAAGDRVVKRMIMAK